MMEITMVVGSNFRFVEDRIVGDDLYEIYECAGTFHLIINMKYMAIFTIDTSGLVRRSQQINKYDTAIDTWVLEVISRNGNKPNKIG